ncbi:MAG: thiamine pyrophosphate-binding protein [Alphaproteobacteria bacterium]|nr:thiamine pyrophosphate-binding protein [Alphaproteobacteria bacterium]
MNGKRTVADAIAATLKAYGAEFAFGIPGNDVLELIRACEEAGIRFVLAKSEPSAAFMADAVWQVSGRPAVLIPALGPGLANAISGIAGALQERSAIVVLAGEMTTRLMGIYTHQVFDHVALAAPVTKLAATLNPGRAAQQTAKALDVALTYPAGPVLLNCPADLSRADSGEPAQAPPRRLPTTLDEAATQTGRALIRAARRPLALVGRGALRAGVAEPLLAFVEAWGMPVLTTYKAKGALDERHRLALGSLGLSPIVDAVTTELVGAADLLVLVGFDPIELRDAWIDAWPADRAVLSLDWGPLPHRMFPAGTEVHGELPSLLARLTGGPPVATWPAETLGAHRSKVAEIARPRMPAAGISPAALFKAVSDRVRPDWLLTVDVGAHRILANHAILCRTPGQLLQSNGLGHMGYALPAAIGAALAKPGSPVVALIGDGSLLMSLGDLAVAAEHALPIVVVVLDDQALALIKLKQAKMQMAPRAVDFAGPRFDILAKGFGIDGTRVESQAEFERAFDAALETKRPTVIDAIVDPSEYWEQM